MTEVYDPASNMLFGLDLFGTAGSSWSCQYDAANHVARGSRTCQVTGYAYDPCGNRINANFSKSVNGLATLTYSPMNAVVGSRQTGSTNLITTCAYDAAVNRLLQNAGGALTTSRATGYLGSRT